MDHGLPRGRRAATPSPPPLRTGLPGGRCRSRKSTAAGTGERAARENRALDAKDLRTSLGDAPGLRRCPQSLAKHSRMYSARIRSREATNGSPNSGEPPHCSASQCFKLDSGPTIETYLDRLEGEVSVALRGCEEGHVRQAAGSRSPATSKRKQPRLLRTSPLL